MGSLLKDLQYGLRMLIKYRAMTSIILLSIGLSISANTTVFTWMDVLVLNPCPLVKEPDRIVAVNLADKDGGGGEAMPFSYLTYLDWRNETKSLDGLIAHVPTRINMRQGNEQKGEPVWAEMVSSNYFDVLQVPAMMGRTFAIEEERNAAQVAVISYNLWQQKFFSDKSIIGKNIHINGTVVTIIGVTPQGFKGVLAAYGFDLWFPLTLQPLVTKTGNRLTNRADSWLQGTARLKQGVTLQQANEELRTLALRISKEHGEAPLTSAMVKLMRQRFSGVLFYPLFSALLGIAGLVLLIACANVANLLIARATSQKKEIGIRLALGATRFHIIRSLFIQSLLLSVFGGIVGLLFTSWTKDLFFLLYPQTGQPTNVTFEISWRVIAFAAAVTLATAILFGLAPALRVSNPDLITTLKNESRNMSVTRSRFRNLLVIAQVALSLVALVCAGLFLRSLWQAQKIDIGFSDPDHILLVTTNLNAAGYNSENGVVAIDQLVKRFRNLPGIKFTSFSTMVPLGFSGHSFSTTSIEGYSPGPDEQVSTERVLISDGYFETMGIPIVKGRAITEQDSKDGQRVAVINEAFAERYFPTQDPIGKRIDQGPGWATIVGIAKNSKYQELTEGPSPVVYSALQQWYSPLITLHIRTANNPKTLIESVRREFQTFNADLLFLDPRTMTEHISAATYGQMFGASTLSSFGLLALLLAMLGLYGILSYIVNQRTREIAIRIAVGAKPKDVMKLVFKEGLILILTGIAIGTVLAFVCGRLLQSQLLNIRASDPVTFISIVMLLLIVGSFACFIPARRAMRVDPMEALRQE